jgi:hypothetical protein
MEQLKKATEEEHNDAIDTMRKFTSDKGNVGIFWYDVKENKLIGVSKVPTEVAYQNEKGFRTTTVLHRDFFPAIMNKFPEYFDFMDVERGRLFYDTNNNKYFVMVGSWAKDYPQVKDLIISEFGLEGREVELKEDEHWDIGRGDSDLII